MASKTPQSDFIRKMFLLQKAGLANEVGSNNAIGAPEQTVSFEDKLNRILRIMRSPEERLKAHEALYIIYYDIQSNKVRRYISKYLERKGLERIQRSVFAGRTSRDVLEEVSESLKMVNEVYENDDSIIILPIGMETYKSMRLIGKNTEIARLAESPHTLYI